MQVSDQIMQRWDSAVNAMGIPQEFYNNIKIRFLKGSYPIGVVYNPGREKRPSGTGQKVRCHMCRMAKEAQDEPIKNIFPNKDLRDYIATPNGFPPTKGAILFITKKEREMYNTQNLDKLEKDLPLLFKISNENGYYLYHNTLGGGATIDIHEHYHGTTLYELQNKVGQKFGFNAVDMKPTNTDKKVYFMPEFPFAHLIFNESDTDKITSFLKKLNKNLTSPLENKSIPHTLSQEEKGVLISPLRIDVGKSMGSERAPGYFFVPTEQDFESTTYESAMNFMKERFYPKELNLERLL